MPYGSQTSSSKQPLEEHKKCRSSLYPGGKIADRGLSKRMYPHNWTRRFFNQRCLWGVHMCQEV